MKVTTPYIPVFQPVAIEIESRDELLTLMGVLDAASEAYIISAKGKEFAAYLYNMLQVFNN